MTNSKKKVLLTVFQTVDPFWKTILEKVSKNYETTQPYTFEYKGDRWDEFFLKMYNISNMFVDDSLVGKLESQDPHQLLEKIEKHLRSDPKKHNGFLQIVRKSDFLIRKSGSKKMLAIPVFIEEKDWRPLMNLKNEIRDKSVREVPGLTRWSVIHSFHLGENSDKAEEFIHSNCHIKNFSL